MDEMLTVEMQIANRARKHRDNALTNLHEFINEQMLHASFLELNKNASAGVNGETWRSYNVKREEGIPQ